jgi:hypothetical protein
VRCGASFCGGTNEEWGFDAAARPPVFFFNIHIVIKSKRAGSAIGSKCNRSHRESPRVHHSNRSTQTTTIRCRLTHRLHKQRRPLGKFRPKKKSSSSKSDAAAEVPEPEQQRRPPPPAADIHPSGSVRRRRARVRDGRKFGGRTHTAAMTSHHEIDRRLFDARLNGTHAMHGLIRSRVECSC